MVTVAGEVKVLDFGTARAQFEHREAETQALAFGSAAYMAPERMMGDPDGPAGDIFSLGVTLYELLSAQSFGKIFIRGEKFDTALNERIDGIDLRDLGQARETQVRQVLRLMLAYEPEVRPTAQMVVELMEALAEEVQDGSLRRFCREVVTPAHAVQEPVTSKDPFTGSTLFEDSSRIRNEALEEVEARVISESGSHEGGLSPEPETAIVEPGSEYMADVQETQVVSGLVSQASPVDPETPVEEPVPVDASDTGPAEVSVPETGSGGLGMVGLSIIGLILSGALLYAGYVFFLQNEPEVPAVVEQPSEYKKGARIDTEQAAGKGGALVLNVDGVRAVKVTISHVESGFNFKWDGSETLELLDLAPGKYRARVRTQDRSVDEMGVVDVKRGVKCAYRYNLNSGGDEWEAEGC